MRGGSDFLERISLYRLSEISPIIVGLYKMKTCTQIWDFGFRAKINVVSPSDSAN